MATFALILFCIVAAALSAVVLRALRALSSTNAVVARHTTRQPAARMTAKRTSAPVEEEKSFPYFA